MPDSRLVAHHSARDADGDLPFRKARVLPVGPRPVASTIIDRAPPRTPSPITNVRIERVSVERPAVQRRARRTKGSLMLLRFPCGGIVRCNGLLDGICYGAFELSCQGSITTSRQASLRCDGFFLQTDMIGTVMSA